MKHLKQGTGANGQNKALNLSHIPVFVVAKFSLKGKHITNEEQCVVAMVFTSSDAKESRIVFNILYAIAALELCFIPYIVKTYTIQQYMLTAGISIFLLYHRMGLYLHSWFYISSLIHS